MRDALFGSRFGGARPMLGPPTGRYEVEFGRGFVFDRAGREGALLKFDDSSEILALTATPGPRGDVIFKDDVGDPILRATRIGGVTLFTPDRPEGAAAAQMGAAPTLRPPASIGPQALIRALAQASARASRAAQHLVEFDAPEVTPASDWVFADAAALTSEAFLRVLQKAPSGRALLARFFQVRLASGDAPDVVSQGAVLRITVAPDRGAAGRPSSQRIFLVLTGR